MIRSSTTAGLIKHKPSANRIPANEVAIQDVLEGAERTAPDADLMMSFVLGGDPKKTEVQRVMHSIDGYFNFDMTAAQAEEAVRGKRLVSTAKKWGTAALTGLIAAGAVTAITTLSLGTGGAVGLAAFAAVASAGGIANVKELAREQAKFRRVEEKIPRLAERAAERLSPTCAVETSVQATLLAED